LNPEGGNPVELEKGKVGRAGEKGGKKDLREGEVRESKGEKFKDEEIGRRRGVKDRGLE